MLHKRGAFRLKTHSLRIASNQETKTHAIFAMDVEKLNCDRAFMPAQIERESDLP
jgi:hypothetical protein